MSFLDIKVRSSVCHNMIWTIEFEGEQMFLKDQFSYDGMIMRCIGDSSPTGYKALSGLPIHNVLAEQLTLRESREQRVFTPGPRRIRVHR